MYNIKIIFFLLFSIIVLSSNTSSQAANSAPIHIEADEMMSQEIDNSVIFSGNVDATQGELRILSDSMQAFYNSAPNTEGNKQISKLVCTGKVKITKGKWLGVGDQMEYISQNNTILLTGNAKTWKGRNMVKGDKIIHYLDEGRSVAVGSKPVYIMKNGKKIKRKSRVSATIIPTAKKKK